MRGKERIPLHDHVDNNSGGRINRAQVTAAVAGVLTSTTTDDAHTLDGPQHLEATGTSALLATAAHSGLMPPLSGDPSEFLAGDGSYEKPNLALAVNTVGAAGATETLDLDVYNRFDLTLTANCTISFSNPPASVGEWAIRLLQDGTGGWTVTWPASVVWRDTDGTQTATAPTLATAAGASDTVFLATLDGGTTYGASVENGSNGGGASALDDLTDVTITTPAADDTLRYVGGVWVNDNRRWEPVTTNPGTGPELVWDGDEIVMTWATY